MNKITRALLVQNTFFEFGAGLFGPIYAIFVEEVGGSILDAGIAWAIFLISIGLFQFFISKYIDNYKSKKVVIITTILYAIVIFAYIFVSDVYQLFILQFFAGFIIAIDNPAWTTWYTKFQIEGKRGRDFSLMYMSNNISKGFAILLGATIAHIYGFKIIFILGSLFILSSLIFIIKAES